jgi:hypothetical protein
MTTAANATRLVSLESCSVEIDAAECSRRQLD